MKVYIGIHWSENKHDVCFLDDMGEVLLMQQIAHTITGFRQLDQCVNLSEWTRALRFERLKVFLRAHHHTQARSWP